MENLTFLMYFLTMFAFVGWVHDAKHLFFSQADFEEYYFSTFVSRRCLFQHPTLGMEAFV